jgi:hypothetical protein
MIRYGEMKTTHRFSELALELEIIKISPEFVAGFQDSQKKNISLGTSRKNVEFLNVRLWLKRTAPGNKASGAT